jgi:N-acetyl sugar amidotransferase
VLKGEAGQYALDSLISRIKASGKNSEYDCIIGVSGGVDSTYTAYLTNKLGLRALAVHFDNGWDSELAVKNIERVLKTLDIDLYTYVVNWPEFRDLQMAFLYASTPDGEIPTDHAINALLWREAARHGVKFIITGMNFATESINVPNWAYGHSDWRYIKDVHTRFGHLPLGTYPKFTLRYLFYVNVVLGVRTVSLLNYVDYCKETAVSLLQSDLGWIHYGGKHHESIYTRFFQGYILPQKFGIDKRYGHLSDLINSGQMSREQAIDEIRKPPYDPDIQEQDFAYVIKKLGINHEEFDRILNLPSRSFRDFRNSYFCVQFFRQAVNKLRFIGAYPK